MAHSTKIAPLCYVLAPTYHGATTLSARANLHPDILSLGTGNPTLSEKQVCSCGEDVLEFCPFWTKAAQAIGIKEDHPYTTLLPQAPHLGDSPTVNKWLNGLTSLVANEVGPKTWKIFYEPAERFFNIHDRFLTYCQNAAPHKVFLDAERSMLKFMALASMEFPVSGAIHLIRDPRGYAAAWKKYYPETPVEKLGMEWAAAHTRIRRLAHAFPKVPFLTLTYEELMEQPMQTSEKMLKFMDLEVLAESEMALDPQKNHMLGLQSIDHVAGMAPKTDNWRETLSAEDQKRVVKAAGPLFAELGYKT